MSSEKESPRRVGVVLNVDQNNKVVNLIGYGEMLGNFPLKERELWPEDLQKADVPNPHGAVADMLPADLENPLIKLDNGGYAWGCECWFADEDHIKQDMESCTKLGYTIVDVDMNAKRQQYREQAEAIARSVQAEEQKPETAPTETANEPATGSAEPATTG